MYSLFLDTTSGLTLGLLDENLSWIAYESSDEKRPSEVIHEKIFSMLAKFDCHLNQMQIFTVAGPGSYTGMRLSEGFAEIASSNGIKIFSLYHFEVPQLVGIASGRWITNAFKNEIFSYQWNGAMTAKELLSKCDEEDAFTIEKTRELIRLNSVEIFSKVVLLNEKKETYYFRTLEEEFG